jgi:protocatechuate 3,4-dioxygenase beta subunit
MVTVDSNDAAAEVSLTLVRGSLSGYVRDADGKPVANAVVRIVTRAAGAAGDGPTVSVALTNDLGEYKVYGLQAGEYRVGATVPNGFPGSEIWFSRSANPAGVTGLTVSDGDEITNIDIVVPRR